MNLLVKKPLEEATRHRPENYWRILMRVFRPLTL
jgi:hypothetical protein